MDERDKEAMRAMMARVNEKEEQLQRAQEELRALRASWHNEHDERVRLEEQLRRARTREEWATKRYSVLFDALNEESPNWLDAWLNAQGE